MHARSKRRFDSRKLPGPGGPAISSVRVSSATLTALHRLGLELVVRAGSGQVNPGEHFDGGYSHDQVIAFLIKRYYDGKARYETRMLKKRGSL